MRWVQVLAAALLALAATGAGAQGWPQKPVRFIVPFPPGGATDISARLLGEKLSQIWGQQVVIENRGGAGGGVGAAEAARAAPDGYTLFFPSGSVVTANQHIYAKLNYDPEKDFVPVTNVVSGPQVVAVPAGSPHKTVKELIEALKANPGKLTFGHAGIGSQTHLAAENFLNAAKVDAVAVPYKGEGPALAGLVERRDRLHRHQRRRHAAAHQLRPRARARRDQQDRGAAASRRAAGGEDPARASRTPAGSASSRLPARRRTSSTRCTATPRRRSKRATSRRASTCRASRRSATRPRKWARR